jgi:RNA polymerase sigma-70 factor (ECF subfamily)
MAEPGRGFAGSEVEDRERVFARIVDEHARLLYRVAHAVLRHEQDAEDAVQDALLKLYRGEGWRGMREERAFLARVVWRAALDRKTKRMEYAQDDAELRLADARPGPEEMAAEGDELEELIEELPAELKEPLLLTAMEALSSREVGEVLGLPEGTVRTRLMRARGLLRERFEALQAAGREVAAGDRSGR